MDSRLTDTQIESALGRQALAPMPRSVTADVLARIQISKRPALFSRDDALLALVILISTAALWFTFQNLPAIVVAKLRVQVMLLYQNILVNMRWILPSMVFGLMALLIGISIPALLRSITRSR